jgi:hypothetical protein
MNQAAEPPYTASEARDFEKRLLARVKEMIEPGGVYHQLRVVSEELVSVDLAGSWPDTQLVVRTRDSNGDVHETMHAIWDFVRGEGDPRQPYTLQGTAQLIAIDAAEI